MRKTKRFISLLVVFLMLCSLMIVPVSAADNSNTIQVSDSTELSNAVNNATSDITIIMTNDIDCGTEAYYELKPAADINVTLDGAGKYKLTIPNGTYGFRVTGFHLTIQNMTVSGHSASTSKAGIRLMKTAEISIKNVDFVNGSKLKYWIAAGNSSGSTINLYSATFDTSAKPLKAISVEYGCTLNFCPIADIAIPSPALELCQSSIINIIPQEDCEIGEFLINEADIAADIKEAEGSYNYDHGVTSSSNTILKYPVNIVLKQEILPTINMSVSDVKNNSAKLTITVSDHGLKEYTKEQYATMAFSLSSDLEGLTFGNAAAKQDDTILYANVNNGNYEVGTDSVALSDSPILIEIPVTVPSDAAKGDYKIVMNKSSEYGAYGYIENGKILLWKKMDTPNAAIISIADNDSGSGSGENGSVSISIGNGTTAGTTVDGVTTFKVGTSDSAPTVSVTAPENGWKVGINTFTVSSEKACTVIVKNAGGTYTKLAATAVSDAENTYSFTTSESFDANCEIIVSMTGDINGDGAISQADYLSVLSAIRGASLEGVSELRADVNSDSSISQVDYLSILSAIRGADLNW